MVWNSALDTAQALKNMEEFLEVSSLALDLTMTSNLQSKYISIFADYMFLSSTLRTWEAFRVEGRPASARENPNSLAQNCFE